MTRGGKAALLTATAVLGGCVASSGNLKIRAVGDPISTLPRGDEMAVARGQLALGNVGLALEAFRKVQRYRPSDPAPLVGIADCYLMMSRLDLAQSNYEAALALAPRDPAILRGLAQIFEFEGQPERAAQVRREAQAAAAALAAFTTVPAHVRVANITPIAPRSSVTVALPPARPADAKRAVATLASMPHAVAAPAIASASVTVKLPPARPAERQAQLPVTVQGTASPAVATKVLASASEPVDLAAAPVTRLHDAELARLSSTAAIELPPAEPVAPQPAAIIQPPRQLAASTTLDSPAPLTRLEGVELGRFSSTVPIVPLPEPVPAVPGPAKVTATVDVKAAPVTKLQAAELRSLAPKIAMALPPPAPVPPEPKPAPDALPAQAAGPRLVRLSPREVALVTTNLPTWRPVMTATTKMASITAVRWVPLTQPGAKPNIQVVNAARSQGLAASARTVLSDRGWRRIGIGTATAARDTSVVFYPRERAKLGRSLAAQFGIRAKMVSGKSLVVVLGRDKVGTVRALSS